MVRKHEWKRADTEQPHHKRDTWSKEVICLTNLGGLHKLSFGGVWQRLHSFLPGEEVEWWIEDPQQVD